MSEQINYYISNFKGMNAIGVAIAIVGCLIILVSIVALVVSVCLAFKYVKYNKKKNQAGLTGEQAARRILDQNGLQEIQVKCSGSLMFGNSYSHYFKKVRLRRRTWKKDSVASLAMASQKSALAILDKEHDPDMVSRIKLIPIMTFGPLAFIPLIIIGAVLDIIRMEQLGPCSVICTAIGMVFYLLSVVLNLRVLNTEKKAQARAIMIVSSNGMATQEEIRDMEALFRLYNIEYVNNMILSMLEAIYNALRIIEMLENGKSSSK